MSCFFAIGHSRAQKANTPQVTMDATLIAIAFDARLNG